MMGNTRGSRLSLIEVGCTREKELDPTRCPEELVETERPVPGETEEAVPPIVQEYVDYYEKLLHNYSLSYACVLVK
jgi:hypothetical protein